VYVNDVRVALTEQWSLWQSKERGEAMNQHDGSPAAKHAAVVRRAIARQLKRIDMLKALGFPRSGAEQALEVLLRVLKLFEERERKLRARAAPRQRGSAAPRCVSPPLISELR
jgi:hypothetical protein